MAKLTIELPDKAIDRIHAAFDTQYSGEKGILTSEELLAKKLIEHAFAVLAGVEAVQASEDARIAKLGEIEDLKK